MFRTEDEKRKFENRAAAAEAALEQIQINPGSSDAQAEIEDDWLNLFARLAEDKSSEELRRLFGKILAGEIKKPGSFSLRTIQLLATLSQKDASRVSEFLSFAINSIVVPWADGDGLSADDRLFMEELGIAGHPSHIGGMALTLETDAGEPTTVGPVARLAQVQELGGAGGAARGRGGMGAMMKKPVRRYVAQEGELSCVILRRDPIWRSKKCSHRNILPANGMLPNRRSIRRSATCAN